jgi:GNAT superfamily N-acetyltransferase
LPFGTPPEERAYELKRLYLADAAKGGGVADALMHWACARAVGFGARVMYLGVWSENVRAQRFYARHGFVKCGAYQFPVGGTLDDEWIMRRTL